MPQLAQINHWHSCLKCLALINEVVLLSDDSIRCGVGSKGWVLHGSLVEKLFTCGIVICSKATTQTRDYRLIFRYNESVPSIFIIVSRVSQPWLIDWNHCSEDDVYAPVAQCFTCRKHGVNIVNHTTPRSDLPLKQALPSAIKYTAMEAMIHFQNTGLSPWACKEENWAGKSSVSKLYMQLTLALKEQVEMRPRTEYSHSWSSYKCIGSSLDHLQNMIEGLVRIAYQFSADVFVQLCDWLFPQVMRLSKCVGCHLQLA